MVPPSRPRNASHRLRSALIDVGADRRGEKRRANDLSPARLLAIEQCGDDSECAVHSGEHISDGDSHALRVVGPRAGDRHETRLALRNLVVAGPGRLRAVMSEARNRQQNGARVELVNTRIVETQTGESSHSEIFDENVCPFDERGES
ncbi:unannotated protein [freshwater metagenome]|uniref:Unannotated protein n=1 Tax=freshwater metagenome TaxID=449393 RepID=A0A6J6BRI6_9ZZZZ